MQNHHIVMRKRQDKMNKRHPSSFQKSAIVRWVEDEKKQTLVSENQYNTEALLEGELINYKVKSGFSLHGGTTTELTDFQVIATAQKALIIIILFKGKLDFSYDDVRFIFEANTEPKGMVVNLMKPATFRRSIQKDNQVSKLNILLPIDWIKERAGLNTNIATFINQHLMSFKLHLTDKLLDLSAEIIRCSSPKGFLERINLETLTQMLLLEIFEQLCMSKSIGVNKQSKAYDEEKKGSQVENSLDELATYIEANLDRDLSAKELAQHAAMSESNLQRKFKMTFGYSIQSYIRRRRLEIARQNLDRGVASVTEVAYSAGYRHPSNFTNAFKKAFGYPPVVAVNKGKQSFKDV